MNRLSAPLAFSISTKESRMNKFCQPLHLQLSLIRASFVQNWRSGAVDLSTLCTIVLQPIFPTLKWCDPWALWSRLRFYSQSCQQSQDAREASGQPGQKVCKSFHGIPVKIPPGKKNRKSGEAERVCVATAVKMKSYSFSHPASLRPSMLILTHQCSVIITLFALAKQLEKKEKYHWERMVT